MTFEDRARAVLKDYIRSVVLIDDRWPEVEHRKPDPVDPEMIDDAPEELEARDLDAFQPARSADERRPAAPEADHQNSDCAASVPTETEVETANAGSNDASRTSNSEPDHELLHVRTAVMDSGIIFAGVRYVARDSSRREAAKKLALRSDVLILDWNLAGNDGGETALELLDELRERGSGPRFIYIFTQSDALEDIARGVRERLGATNQGDRKPEPIDFSIGGLSFAVRRKRYSSAGRSGAVGDVKPADLVDDALSALASARPGLLDMALVELTTRHRWHLNSMIERIGSRFDAALITEHALDGALTLTDGTIHEILFDEWRAQLSVRPDPPLRILSDEGVNAYLQKIVTVSRFSIPSATSELEEIAGMKGKGLSAEQKKAIRGFKKAVKAALEPLCSLHPELKIGDNMQDETAVALALWPQSIDSIKNTTLTTEERRWEAACAAIAYCCDANRGTKPSAESLRLQSLLTQRRHLPTRITQGTVCRLALTAGGEQTSAADEWSYLVCTTPLCDAYRPGKVDNYFTFLTARQGGIDELKEHPLDDGAAIVVTPPRAEPIVLVVRLSPTVALHIADPTVGSDRSILEATAWPSSPAGARPIGLAPVAQLRREHAFHLASRALSHAGRIGLDHVEFLRGR